MPSPNAGRKVAQRRFPTSGVACERCGQRPAVDRHHRDGDAQNNTPENVERLCEPCHAAAHTAAFCSRCGGPMYARPNGTRHCKACHNARQNAYRYRVGTRGKGAK